MGLQTINTIQSGINSNYSDRYIKQALANLGQRTGAKGDSIINSSFTIKELLNSTSTNNIVAYYNDDNNIILRDTIDENISIELSYVNTINNISFNLLEYIPCQQSSGAITKLSDTKIIKNTDSYFFISKCINKENLLDSIVCFEFAELSEQLINGVIIVPKAGYIDYYEVSTNNNELEIVNNYINSIQLSNFSIDDIYDSLLFENTVENVIDTLITGVQFKQTVVLNSDEQEPYLNKLKYYTLNYPKYIKTEFNNAIYFVNDSYIGLKKSILYKFIDEVYKNSNYKSTDEFIMYFPSNTEIQYIINENTHAIYFSYDIPVYYSNELKNSSFNNNFSSLNNLNDDEKYKHIVASIYSEDKISMFRFLVTYINDDKYIDNIIVSKVQTLPYITTNEQEENIWVLNDVKTSIPATGEDAGNPNIMMLSFTKQDNNSNVQVLHTYNDHNFKERIQGFYEDYNTTDDSLVDAEFDYDSNLFVNVDNEQSFKFKIKLPNVNKILELNKHYGKIIKNTLLWTFVDLKYSDTKVNKVAVKDIENEQKESYTLDELVHGTDSGKSSFITVFWQIENNNGNYTWKYIPNYLFDKQPSNTTDLPALDLGSMLGLKDMVNYFLDNLYEPDKYLHSWLVFDPIIGSEKQSGDNTYADALFNTYYPVIKTDNADYYSAEQIGNSNTGYNNFLNLVPKFLRRRLNNKDIIDFEDSLVKGINDKDYADTLFSIKDQAVSQVSKLTGSGDFVPNADDNNVYPLFDFREVLTFNQTLLNRLDVVSVGSDKKVYHAYIGNNPTTSPDILTIGTSETNNNMKNSQTLPSDNFGVYDRVCIDMPLNETKDAKFENLIIDKDSNGNYFSIVTINQDSDFISNITDTIIPATKYMGELTIGRKVFDASKYVSQDIFKHIVVNSTGITCEVINNTDDETEHNEEIMSCSGCSNNSFGYERLSFILYFDKVDDNYAVKLIGCEQIISTSNYILGPTVDTNAIDIPLTISLVNNNDKKDAKLTIVYTSFTADGQNNLLLNLNDTLRYSYNPYVNFDNARILDSSNFTEGEGTDKNCIITTITIDFANNASIYLLGNGNGFSINDYITISCNKDHEISGNIESLLKKLDPLTSSGKGRSLMRSLEVNIPNKELPIFPYLFKGNENLIDASKLRLPEDIYDFSYYSMFDGCKKLKNGPKLISKKVAAYCYSNMFRNCSELINTPELHSTNIAPLCYQSMFEGCLSITKAPNLYFTEVSASCCYRMFMDCKSLLEPAKMTTEYFSQNFDSLYNFITNSKIGDNHFYISNENGKYTKNNNGIYNKTFINDVIIDPSYINQKCFSGLYRGCEKLEDLSNLRIYITQSDIKDDRLKVIGVSNLYSAFSDIFRECTSLSKAPLLGKDKLYESDMSRVFYYCTLLETVSLPGFLPNSSIVNNTNENIPSIYESAFEGCTSLKNITGFNSTLMSSYRCYADMFNKCVSLENIPLLAYEISYKGSYAQMFKGCKTLTKAELKFTEMETTTPINQFGYSFAYYGSCTNMFEGCENLNDISVEFVKWYNTGDDIDNLYIDSNTKLLYSQRGEDGNFGNPIQLNSDNQILTTELLNSTFAKNMGTVETPNYKVKIDGNDTEYSIFNIKLVPTFNWLKDIAQSGKFTCYTELPHDKNYLTNPNYIPWDNVNIRPDNNDYFYIDIINNDLSGAYYEISLRSTNEDVSNDELPVLEYYAVFNVEDGDNCDNCTYDKVTGGYITEGNAIIVDKWNNLYNPANGYNEQLSVSSPLKIDAETYPIKYRTRIYFRNKNEKMTKPFNARFIVKIKDVNGVEITDVTSCHYHIGGNIVTLLKQTKYNEYTDKEIPNNAFSQLFNNENLLTLASGLKLPKIVSDSIYYKMFENSTNLLIGPMLPATSLKPKCYQEMFKGCVSLTNLASTSTNWVLPATELADCCYNNMFTNCISLQEDLSFLKLSTYNLAKGCYKYMFDGCTQITDTPRISCQSNFAEECFAFMFNNCENLTKITLNISNLNNIEDFKSAKENYFDNWVYGVKTTRNTKGISFKYNNDEYAYNETYYNTNYYNDSFIPYEWLADPAYLTFETTEECEIYIKGEDFSGNPTGDFSTNLQYRIINNDGNCGEFINYLFYYDESDDNYGEGQRITLNPGQKLNFVSKNNDLDNCKFSIDKAYYVPPTSSSSGHYESVYFTFCTSYNGTKPDITVSGNINSLVYKYFNNISIDDNYIKPNSFARLFKNNNTIKNVSEDFLKHTPLADNCYENMFYGCNSLTEAPELPATSLANYCYSYMFYGCTSLTEAPELPATTLSKCCYHLMFEICTNLSKAPKLPATTLDDSCYYRMFYGCTSLIEAPELPAKTLTKNCYNRMFSYCTNLTKAPEIKAETLADSCCEYMFEHCNKIETAPELKATILVQSCYNNMFYRCTNLNYIKVGFINWNDKYTDDYLNSTHTWVYNVASTGTFECPEELTIQTGISYVPEGWSVKTYQ